MTHVQIDDGFFDHPKVLSVSKEAKLLSVAAICYCGNMLTDGFIPHGAVAVLAAKTGVSKPKIAVDELLAARLWDATEGGYKAHDYLDYNTSAEKVQAKRDAAKARMQRVRSPEVRANNERSSQNVQEPTTETTTTSSIEPNGSQELETPPEPPKPKIKHRLPEDWQPSDRHREKLAGDGFSAAEIDAEAEKFRNHHRHKGDTGLEWDRSFLNWMANARDFAGPRPIRQNGYGGGDWFTIRGKQYPMVNGLVRLGSIEYPPEIAQLEHNNSRRLRYEQEWRDAHANVS